MAFFRSRTVNLLNLHYGINSIALARRGLSSRCICLRRALRRLGVRLARADPRRAIYHQADRGAVRRPFRHATAGRRRDVPHRSAISAAGRSAWCRSRSPRAVRHCRARRHVLLVELSRLFRRARQSRASRVRTRRARSDRRFGRHRQPAVDGRSARRLRAAWSPSARRRSCKCRPRCRYLSRPTWLSRAMRPAPSRQPFPA